METCPNCEYTHLRRTTYCPHCGLQLTHPIWKKVVAWILLLAISYGIVKCNLRIMNGLDKLVLSGYLHQLV